MENNPKKEVVGIVRKFTGTTDPTPVYEVSFTKNIRAGERLYLDPTQTELYRRKK